MPLIEEVMDFIDHSPCSYFAVDNIRKLLLRSGFEALEESGVWNLKKGGRYFVIRGGSALIAFTVPEGNLTAFAAVASHSDSPSFKLKENPELDVLGKYTRLNVEPYGGMILSTWLDRPLSVAGRVLVKTGSAGGAAVESRLLWLEEDTVLIPNQAIHMNREINNGYVYKKQVDMVPLWGSGQEGKRFRSFLADRLSVEETQILDYDLFLYNRMKCTVWGSEKEFLSGPRLDDLECAYVTLKAFLDAEGSADVAKVYCLYDNEEVGSGTRAGAGSTFLKDCMKRIVLCLGGDEASYLKCTAASYMISADNAHGVHPNFPEVSDSSNKCFLNEGVVLKFQASQKYATDGMTAALFRSLAEKSGARVQSYYNRSDIPGGSTLGNISATQVPMRCADIGLAQLAMHSAYETAGAKDLQDMYLAVSELFRTKFVFSGDAVTF